jgi:nucleoid-associated protein YgaU
MFKPKKSFELSPKLKFGVGRGHSPNRILKICASVSLFLAVILAGNALRLVFGDKLSLASAGAVTPQVLGASDTKSTQDQSIQFTNYTIQKGDTLFNVSQRYNISWTTLATINNLKSPFALKPGQSLQVPKQ